MMKLDNLKPSEGSKKKTKRLGRGNGSGLGTTSSKGHKGQIARSGGYHKVGFEGGQMPLQRRLPKFGFNNVFRKEFVTLNLSVIDTLPNDKDITPDQLIELGVIKNSHRDRIKILGNGDLSKAYNVKAHSFSKSAEEKIKKAGGKVEVIT